MLGVLKQRIKEIGPVYRTINRAKGLRLHEPVRASRKFERIGTVYGGWGIDPSALDQGSIVYSVGIGEDISFDLALIEQIGCVVHGFDPTPIAIDWIAGQTLPPQFRFHPIGLSNEDAEVEFQLPPVDGYHSFSLTKAADAAVVGSVICPVRRLSTIMRDLGHETIDLLKMDIEGFEYPVLDDLMASKIRPRQLLVEFHHLCYAHTTDETRAAVSALSNYGYEIAWVSDFGREYNFVERR